MAPTFVTLTRSLRTVAAGLTASDISLTDSNMTFTFLARLAAADPLNDQLAILAPGYWKSSTTDAATPRPTISSIGSAASAGEHLLARGRVAGWRGVNSVQQS